MSLAHTPLSTPPSASSSVSDGCVFLDEILLHEMLAFEGRGSASPFLTPADRRSPNTVHVGCELGDATSSSTLESLANSSHAHAYTTKPNLSRQTTPTSIDSYVPPVNEYAQLAELWHSSCSYYTHAASPSSALVPVVRRESSLAPLTPRTTGESGDALLDLFMQVMPAESIADPAARRQVGASDKFTPVTTTTTTITTTTTARNSLRLDKKRKTGGSFKSKKCTYAARRREVSALRSQTAALETQVRELRERREAAERERIHLARARDENVRLRAAVASQEAQIRRVDVGGYGGGDVAVAALELMSSAAEFRPN